MKRIAVSKTSKLSIEIFNPQLLKEIKIINNDDFYNDMSDIDDDSDDSYDDISAITLMEFEKTLN